MLDEIEKWKYPLVTGWVHDPEYPVRDGDVTHIIPVDIGGVKETLDLSGYLFKHGIFIQAIRPPTVPKETCRLRITPTALHTKKELGYASEVMIKGAKGVL